MFLADYEVKKAMYGISYKDYTRDRIFIRQALTKDNNSQ